MITTLQKNHNARKISNANIAKICEMYVSGYSVKDIANTTNIATYARVSQIISKCYFRYRGYDPVEITLKSKI